MKRRIALILAAVLVATLLTACGGSSAAQSEQTARPQSTTVVPPEGMASTLPGSASGSEGQAEEAPASSETSPAEIAKSLIGESVDKLYAAVGEPASADYADSCMGEGQDGELAYDGFTVYTHRSGDTEVIQKVDG